MTPRTETAQVVLRPADRPGDLGWIVQAHGEIYAAQFGWDTGFEALVARIVADYAEHRDPRREAGWIAEVDGVRAGCVLCTADAEPGTARLRVLLVTPAARGDGLGTGLVTECLAFAAAAGYRRTVLWTTDNLAAARRIYEGAGFTLVHREPHHGWGREVIGQTWALEYAAAG